MPNIPCPFEGCTYETGDVDATIVVQLLDIHKLAHIGAAATNEQPRATKQRAPKIERPKISDGSSEETWNAFTTRWGMFTRGTTLTPDEKVQHLFQCCDESLGDAILKGHPAAVSGDEDSLLSVIKKLAVIPVPRVVRRNEVLKMKQDHGETTRAFFARIRGKAMTCAYTQVCCSSTCATETDFTDVIIKDVLIAGLVDEEIKKEVLGWAEVDDKSVEETVAYIEAKEMARDAMISHTDAAAISAYRKEKAQSREPPKPKTKIQCEDCKGETDKFVWNQRQKRTIEVKQCLACWRKKNPKGRNQRDEQRNGTSGTPATAASITDETSALLVGAISHQPSIEPIEVLSHTATQQYQLRGINNPPPPAQYTPPDTPDTLSAVGNGHSVPEHRDTKPIIMDHHIFDSRNGWKKSESMAHPTLRLRVSTDVADYNHIGAAHPDIMPSFVTVVTDTGAQSCLWGLQDFYRCGFKDSDLIPVKRTMVAANREEITILGAIFVRLSGTDNLGDTYTAPVMAYVSPSTSKFYLSREALIQLGVIPKNFPRVGAVSETSSVRNGAECGCPSRSLPPERPTSLPFPCCPENNAKMKEWLGARFASSTFNKCPHQLLEGIAGPELELHLDPNATFKVAHTPAVIPLHDMEEVKRQIDADVALGILEKVPYNEPSVICHRMGITRKTDGSIRRYVNMTELNRNLKRETHHVKPPFQQARAIPRNTWKSVTDAWNGFHTLFLREEDRYLTHFITPWGRYRYKVAPQGASVSGDAYTRRYDEIIADVERKTKCVDDTVLWDEKLEDHWWRMVDFLYLMGKNGVILNFEKFQFAQREIDFAGFRITETSVKPLEKYLTAIAEFPTPTRTTDIRSWFGLVHQVSHYNQLTELMAPFKPFLSPRKKFEWTEELDDAFKQSKAAIIDAIKEGVEIFDLEKPTCLRTDYSEIGIGYFLSQKHCSCEGSSPNCCENGWRITLAGSRFLKPAESRYAPVEGEALAIAWSLEQTKYFTQGCANLTVVTDHNPLVGLFETKTLDEITNPRLFSLKQRTLPWRFKMKHRPGKENTFADAASRYPSKFVDEDDIGSISMTEALSGIMTEEREHEQEMILSALSQDDSNVRAVTWDVVREETAKDQPLQDLISLINSVFPHERNEMPPDLVPYWPLRNNLYIIDGVVLMKDRVVIPTALREDAADTTVRIIIPANLRKEVVQSLHSAHQGVGSMNERAKAGVYWPGITSDIKKVRDNCRSCNRIMPSQARTPPIEPVIPSTPFEAIACDYFKYIGKYYFVAADRLSGWVELSQIKVGTNEAGAQGLCTALRRLMVTFGVPVEVSSDGGPEFIACETKAFFKRWGIRHRLSSVSFPSSNGRAELAVKTAKRLIMDNVGADGKLDTDRVVQALLTHRNTPDPGCKLSPAQILLGRQLRDSLPYLDKGIMVFNNPQVHPQWREAWRSKEEALRVRYVKTIEDLSEHSRPLAPLRHGDHVMLQNQRGHCPNKWDNSGTVVETKPNDQYVVKVTGTGRLTLRNRRFLRKFGPHFVPTESSPPRVVRTDTSNSTPCRKPENKMQVPLTTTREHTRPNEPYHSPSTPAVRTPPPRACPSATPQASPETSPMLVRQRLLFGDLPDTSSTQAEQPATPSVATPPPVVFSPPKRARRANTQRTVYDASTGTYKPPSSVPDDV